MGKKNKKKGEKKKKGQVEEAVDSDAKQEETDTAPEEEPVASGGEVEEKVRTSKTIETYGAEAAVVEGGNELDDPYFADESKGSDEDKKKEKKKHGDKDKSKKKKKKKSKSQEDTQEEVVREAEKKSPEGTQEEPVTETEPEEPVTETEPEEPVTEPESLAVSDVNTSESEKITQSEDVTEDVTVDETAPLKSVSAVSVTKEPSELNIIMDADELDDYLKKYAWEKFFALASEPSELPNNKMTSVQALRPGSSTHEVQTDYTETDGHLKNNCLRSSLSASAPEPQEVQRQQSNKMISAVQSLRQLNTQEVQTDEKVGVEFNGSVEDDFDNIIVKKRFQDFSCNVSLDVAKSREKLKTSTADFGAFVLEDFRHVLDGRSINERRRDSSHRPVGYTGERTLHSDDDPYTANEGSPSSKSNFKALDGDHTPTSTGRKTNQRNKYEDGDEYWEDLPEPDRNRDVAHNDRNRDVAHNDRNRDVAHNDRNRDVAHNDRNRDVAHNDRNRDVAHNEAEVGSASKHPDKKSKRTVPTEESSKRKSKKPPHDDLGTDLQDISSCSLLTKITFNKIKKDCYDDEGNLIQNLSIKNKQAGRVDLSIENQIYGILTDSKHTSCKHIQFADDVLGGSEECTCYIIPCPCTDDAEELADFTPTPPQGFQQSNVLPDNQDDYNKRPPTKRKQVNDVSTDAQETGNFASVRKLKRKQPQYVESPSGADDQTEAEQIRSLAKAPQQETRQAGASRRVQKIDSSTSPAIEVARSTTQAENNRRRQMSDSAVQSVDNFTSPPVNDERKRLVAESNVAIGTADNYISKSTNASRRPSVLNDSAHANVTRSFRRTSSTPAARPKPVNTSLDRATNTTSASTANILQNAASSSPEPAYIKRVGFSTDELFELDSPPVRLVVQRNSQAGNVGMERDYLDDTPAVQGEPIVDRLVMESPRNRSAEEVHSALRDIASRSKNASDALTADEELTDAIIRKYFYCEAEAIESLSLADCMCNSKVQQFRLVLEPVDTGDHGSLDRTKIHEDQIRTRELTEDELRALKRAKQQELDDELSGQEDLEWSRRDYRVVNKTNRPKKTSGKPNLKKSSKNGTRTSKEDKDRIVSAVGGKPTGSRIDEEDEGDVKVDSPSQLSPDTDSEKAVSSADSDRSPSRKSRKKAGTSDEEEATESKKGPRLKKKKKKKTKKASRIKKDRKRHESEADVDSTGNDEDSANETTAVGENKHALSSLDSDSEPDKRSKKPVASEDEEDAEDSEKKVKHDKKSQKLRKPQKKPKIKKEKKPTKNEGGDGKMNRRSKKAEESDEVSDSELPTSESVSKVSGSASKVGRKKKTRAVAHSEDEDSEENSPSPPRSRKAKASSPDEESSEVESTPKRKSKSKHAVCESTCMCENSCIPKCCCRVVKFAHCDERACCSKRHTRTRSPESSSDEEEERSERKKRQKRNRQLTESSESDSEEERSRPRTQRNTSKKERRTRNSSSERDRGVMVPVVGSTSMYPYPTQAMGGFSHCTPVPAEAGTSSIFVYVNESDCEDPETLQRVLGEKIKKGTATQSQANPCQYMTCDPACYVADPTYYYNC